MRRSLDSLFGTGSSAKSDSFLYLPTLNISNVDGAWPDGIELQNMWRMIPRSEGRFQPSFRVRYMNSLSFGSKLQEEN